MGQTSYTESLLQQFGMDMANPVATPVDASSKLVQATEDEEGFDQHLYHSGVKTKPRSLVPWRYRMILFTAVQCCSVGFAENFAALLTA